MTENIWPKSWATFGCDAKCHEIAAPAARMSRKYHDAFCFRSWCLERLRSSGRIAQSVERWSNKPLVEGSSPSVTKFSICRKKLLASGLLHYLIYIYIYIWNKIQLAGAMACLHFRWWNNHFSLNGSFIVPFWQLQSCFGQICIFDVTRRPEQLPLVYLPVNSQWKKKKFKIFAKRSMHGCLFV